MPDTNDHLLSAGTPADTKGIQLLETIAVISAAVLMTFIAFDPFGPGFWTSLAVCPLSLVFAYLLRYDRVLRNELDARNEREIRYAFPPDREATLNTIDAPPDFRDAALTLVGDTRWSRIEVAKKLSERVGQTRANEYLPLVLKHADRSVEAGTLGA